MKLIVVDEKDAHTNKRISFYLARETAKVEECGSYWEGLKLQTTDGAL